jgi:hypothetical protein
MEAPAVSTAASTLAKTAELLTHRSRSEIFVRAEHPHSMPDIHDAQHSFKRHVPGLPLVVGRRRLGTHKLGPDAVSGWN